MGISLLVNISLWPIGGFSRFVEIDPNTWCFLRDKYSTLMVAFHFIQSNLDLAISIEVGSHSGIRSKASVVNVAGGDFRCLWVEGKWVGRFCGRIFYVPGRGLRIICEPHENPLSIFSAMVLKCKNLVTSVSGKNVGGSGFRIKISSAVKIKGDEDEVEVKDKKIVSKNLQIANLALHKVHVVGIRYRIMEGESKPI